MKLACIGGLTRNSAISRAESRLSAMRTDLLAEVASTFNSLELSFEIKDSSTDKQFVFDQIDGIHTVAAICGLDTLAGGASELLKVLLNERIGPSPALPKGIDALFISALKRLAVETDNRKALLLLDYLKRLALHYGGRNG